MRITMIGAGYVGLVSGACFAEFGTDVVCIDTNPKKISMLEDGHIPIYEPGLEDMVRSNVEAGRLRFSTDLEGGVRESDAIFLAVGTPTRRGDGHADLSYVFAAVEDIAKLLQTYTVIVTKSTVPVGTGRKIGELITKLRPDLAIGKDFDVVSNPEFLREGSAIEDFMRPNRIVVGCESDKAEAIMEALYRPLYLNETPILFTSLESSEVIKYAANAFLATKITFINEMADLCEKVGADVQQVAKGIGLDRRIGDKFLHSGPGYGGSCFPKDTKALVRTAEQNKVALSIVESVVKANERRKEAMAEKIIAACDGDVAGKTISILGVTFKPNTDDMRDAPALVILPALQKKGARLKAYDPVGMQEAARHINDIVWCNDVFETLQDADCTVLLTEWNEFRNLDFSQALTIMKHPVLVDLRNVYDPQTLRERGITYFSIGRS